MSSRRLQPALFGEEIGQGFDAIKHFSDIHQKEPSYSAQSPNYNSALRLSQSLIA